MKEVDDIQYGGTHYKKGGALQHWNWAPSNGLGYMESAITKYITRWREKNGLEDIQKVGHYLDKLIDQASLGIACPVQTHTPTKEFSSRPRISTPDYVRANGLSDEEALFCTKIVEWSDSGDVQFLHEAKIPWATILQKAIDHTSDASSSYVDQG